MLDVDVGQRATRHAIAALSMEPYIHTHMIIIMHHDVEIAV